MGWWERLDEEMETDRDGVRAWVGCAVLAFGVGTLVLAAWGIRAVVG